MQTRILSLSAVLIFAVSGFNARAKIAERVVDVKSTDGTILKGTYFAAGKSGPGALLFHQSNRTRKEWDMVARRLAAAGINTLTVDSRGHGESGGQEPSGEARKQQWPLDLGAAFQYLISQPGVKRDVIGIGGAGVIGVENSVETARRHSTQVKSLVLLSGETESLDFLRQASQLPELFVVADDDEYPPIAEAMELLYVTAQAQAGNSCTTLRRTKRPGCGMNPSMSAESLPAAATGPTCSKSTPNCPASSWTGL